VLQWRQAAGGRRQVNYALLTDFLSLKFLSRFDLRWRLEKAAKEGVFSRNVVERLFRVLSLSLLLAVFFVPASFADDWNWMKFTKGDEEKTEISSNVKNGAAVYKDKSLDSKLVTTLPNKTKVVIAEFHANKKPNPNPRFKNMKAETWAKLISPVEEWVVADEVAVWYSSLLADFRLFEGIK
jgi:hypothetical protein